MSDILLIGAINIDIEGRPKAVLNKHDSNPGFITVGNGGVGRNICENILYMGGDISMLTAVGNDGMGDGAVSDLISKGCFVTALIKDEPTPMYLSVLDESGDMAVAISDMSAIENLSPGDIDIYEDLFSDVKLLVLDTNLSEVTLKYISEKYKSIPKLVETVSVTKSKRIKDFSGNFEIIKTNLREAEAVTGVSLDRLGEADLEKAADVFLGKGSKCVYITLGSRGVYYKARSGDFQESGIVPPAEIFVKLVSATGAGDAFAGALAVSVINNLSPRKAAEIGSKAAALALKSEKTVNPEVSTLTGLFK